MKKITILLLIFFCNTQLQAQRNHTIYAELGGAGLLYTLNYDMQLLESNDNIGTRIGIGYLNELFIIPLQLNYLLGTKNHKFEIGAGVTPILLGSDTDLMVNAALMYRFQKEDGHFLFRAGLSPNIALHGYGDDYGNINYIFWFWPGVSAGYKF